MTLGSKSIMLWHSMQIWKNINRFYIFILTNLVAMSHHRLITLISFLQMDRWRSVHGWFLLTSFISIAPSRVFFWGCNPFWKTKVLHSCHVIWHWYNLQLQTPKNVILVLLVIRTGFEGDRNRGSSLPLDFTKIKATCSFCE